MKILSIDEQIERMHSLWPDWKVTREDDRTAVWIGNLRPNKTSYRLRIFYRVPGLLENRTVKQVQPRVFVDTPKLRPNSKGELPHVYWPKGDPTGGEPCLCLFDPDHEWTICDYLAETTVPWSSTWLYWYEAWAVSANWFGPSRHEGEATDDGSHIKGFETEEV
ncbi:hypothetical protein [Rhizobium laguerreae]|uniref:hypothetical protein n=1 Tax=Rhizobium laguerreae TaxID=1076926 RepID=UPI001FE99A22|nr:hypothetical protein [Rhizobium laguerreae]